MPEGDTVLRTARRLDAALAGRTLVRAELRWPTLGDVDLAGRTVSQVTAYGKQILTRFADDGRTSLTLRSHLRMEGQWSIVPAGPQHWPAAGGVRVRAVLANLEWTAIGTWLGLLDLVPTDDESSLIGHLGPDIMVDAFPSSGRAEAVVRLLRRPDRTVGSALLDQTNVAGIGTMYMAETLFLQGISPWTPVAEVDVPAALDVARKLLLRGVTTAVPSTTGIPRAGQNTFVHGRSGKPCRRCGAIVRVAMVGDPTKERTAFYCPVCQPGPAPTDGGRARRPLGSNPSRPATGYRRDR
ncbi:endonuclease-8 [Nakamurella panacisegetis]|uniref:DNA-(apurinic or apyrimidinic site) lyase n=1 Tax=Nakamurella panacisegetis TaxID=1090615 RepID=A0A1H0NKW9_9ACTN|nr:DNA-formamidopyrimidine glycosylase family protein [Nakamurella panacisegetis]SDO93319.1 endonuclease-8 [Nakamurella panacisegetis]